MTLSYIPAKEFKDDPPINLALFNRSPSVTLLDYNFPRIPIKDIKGFEVIILLFASLFIDFLHHTQSEGQGSVPADVKRETERLQKLEDKEQERLRREREEEVQRETERLKKQAQEEYLEMKKRQEEVERETERLRWQEGWYSNPDNKPLLPDRPPPYSPPQKSKKKHWWQ